MHSKLRDSMAAADFIARLEKLRYEQTKNLLLVFAAGKPELLAKIESAKTLIDMERVFIEMEDEDAA
jgi:hypothetical protein